MNEKNMKVSVASEYPISLLEAHEVDYETVSSLDHGTKIELKVLLLKK